MRNSILRFHLSIFPIEGSAKRADAERPGRLLAYKAFMPDIAQCRGRMQNSHAAPIGLACPSADHPLRTVLRTHHQRSFADFLTARRIVTAEALCMLQATAFLPRRIARRRTAGRARSESFPAIMRLAPCRSIIPSNQDVSCFDWRRFRGHDCDDRRHRGVIKSAEICLRRDAMIFFEDR